MDRGGGDQGPLGSSTGDVQRKGASLEEMAAKERSDPNQTGGGPEEEGAPESGAGYGNHAMPDVPAE